MIFLCVLHACSFLPTRPIALAYRCSSGAEKNLDVHDIVEKYFSLNSNQSKKSASCAKNLAAKEDCVQRKQFDTLIDMYTGQF